MENTVVRINASAQYDVVIGSALIDACGTLISREISPCRAALISDDRVMALYGGAAALSLQKAGYEVRCFAFPAGEASKTPQTLLAVLDFLAENSFDRGDVVVALGGGVTGDLAGFAAAVYMRGMPFVQMPTTLLAMVDSSVGGKTGVNLEKGKNLAGAFKQPKLVLCDTNVLKTLESAQFSCGMAEVIKYAMICDEAVFEELCHTKGALALSEKRLTELIALCVGIKGRIVAADEFEHGERKLLNFGHTLGHAIEKSSEYAVNHGQAVAIGMAMITAAAEKTGICAPGTQAKLIKALSNFDLPSRTDFDAETLFQAVLSDKKRGGDSITLILPKKAGACFCQQQTLEQARRLIKLGAEA